MTRRAALAFALLHAVLASGSILASQQPSFKTSTLGVRVDVLVTDGRRPVGGLTAGDFELRDDGVLQAIELVDAAAVPVNVVLALDTSGSTTGPRGADLVAASEALLNELAPADRVALTTFSHAVTPRIALTGERDRVRADLLKIAPSGRTSIMDAVYVALTSTLAQPGRSLVVVCTDGSDITSWLRPDDVLDSARRSNAVIYAVTSAVARSAPSLQELAVATGGETLRTTSSEDLRGAFKKILQDFRTRYVLAYMPTGVAAGGFHRIDVRVKRRGLTVKARPGYVGAESPR